jgi:hypothetical protein
MKIIFVSFKKIMKINLVYSQWCNIQACKILVQNYLYDGLQTNAKSGIFVDLKNTYSDLYVCLSCVAQTKKYLGMIFCKFPE